MEERTTRINRAVRARAKKKRGERQSKSGEFVVELKRALLNRRIFCRAEFRERSRANYLTSKIDILSSNLEPQ